MAILNFNCYYKPTEWFFKNNDIYQKIYEFWNEKNQDVVNWVFNNSYCIILTINEYSEANNLVICGLLPAIYYNDEERAKWIVVTILLKVLINQGINIDKYSEVLDVLVLNINNYDEKIKKYADQFLNNYCDTKFENLCFDLDTPLKPNEIPGDSWRKLTDGFSRKNIEYIINQYSSKSDKINAIDIIERVWKKNKPYYF